MAEIHKMKLYIDTSVIGGCYDEEFEVGSGALLKECIMGVKQAVVSDLTLQELEGAPDHVKKVILSIPKKNIEYVVLNEEARQLAEMYIKEKAVTRKYLVDSQHIAIATVNRLDVLVSWNFKHIVNLQKIRLYNAVNLRLGYPLLEIRTPLEVINES